MLGSRYRLADNGGAGPDRICIDNMENKWAVACVYLRYRFERQNQVSVIFENVILPQIDSSQDKEQYHIFHYQPITTFESDPIVLGSPKFHLNH